jgi:hypothetical protein
MEIESRWNAESAMREARSRIADFRTPVRRDQRLGRMLSPVFRRL